MKAANLLAVWFGCSFLFYEAIAVHSVAHKCHYPLGMENGKIPDSAIASSTNWDDNHRAANGRLNFTRTGKRTGGWSARYNDNGQWFQMDAGSVVKVTEIGTQGRADANQWVKSYKLFHSQDGGYFYPYLKGKVFQANKNRNEVVINRFPEPIIARFIRIQPTAWHKHISLRAELYGCVSGFVPIPIPKCMAALGMQSGAIHDRFITASSIWNVAHRAANARLHFHPGGGRTGAWSAKYNNVHQFLQVDFSSFAQIRRISTQGRQDADQWVTAYTVTYSYDGVWWYKYNVMFKANCDRYTVVTHVLYPPIIARYIRIHPTTWYGHISLRVDFYGCFSGFPIPKPKCVAPLGLESGKVPDKAISASTIWNAGHRAANGRLNFRAGKGRTGAWSAKVNNKAQWLQIDFGEAKKFTRMATQGRQDLDQWVTTYTVSYSMDSSSYFVQYKNNKLFRGNQDRNSIVIYGLTPPIVARFIRFHPQSWHGHVSMRAELYGCKAGCAVALGMQSGQIPDKYITASTIWNVGHRAANGRLHFKAGRGRTGAWSSRVNNAHQYLQINLGRWAKVTYVSTQGRQDANQWVKTYILSYSYDGVWWYLYNKVFTGNVNRNSVVTHKLSRAIVARYVRIQPQTWHGHVSMRAELYGCYSGFTIPRPRCVAPVGMESGKIPDSAIKTSSDWNAAHRGANGRLNFKAGRGRTGAWSARHNNQEQYFQVNFAHWMEIRRVAIQGRQDADQWVTSYTLSYSQDGGHFFHYKNKQVFAGNVDRNGIVVQGLSPSIKARFIRINIRSWHGHVSMRTEFYGCRTAPLPVPKCMVPLGMQSGGIPGKHISASSNWNAAHRAANGRLHFQAGGGRTGAWSARHNNAHQFLQVYFAKWVKIRRISTQGRGDASQWVKSYTISFSYDGVWWYSYPENKVFGGNSDRHSIVSHVLAKPLITRYIRIHPKAWQGHISMRVEFYGCTSGFPIPKPVCVAPVGMEKGRIPDRSITASSFYNAAHRPANGRLNFKAGNGRTGAWSALHNDQGQFLQVDFGHTKEIRRVAMQGRQDADQWVTSYTLSFSQDGGHFYSYKNKKVFKGNNDRNTIVIHGLSPPIKARFIRINIRSWHGHVSMRAEFYGCITGQIPPPSCMAGLGMQNRAIPGSHISASSEWNHGHRAANARLHFQAGRGRTGAWSSRHNNVNQWLKVYFGKWVKITRMSTQGRQDANQWVKSYWLSYSYDGVWYYPYLNKKVFGGNNDRHTVVSHVLPKPIVARYIKVHPKTWHGHISMRTDFYGCTKGFALPQRKCVAPVGMENMKIPDASIRASTEYNAAHGARNGRLNFRAGKGRTGAWSARYNDPGQWLQVDLRYTMEIRRVATQGRQEVKVKQWVISYTLSYSQDGGHFMPYKNNQVFKGNHDPNTIEIHGLVPPIRARFIRIHPRTWHGHISMRAEFYGCRIKPIPPPVCMSGLGMQSGAIPDKHISASSNWNHGHRAANARLHFHAGGGRTGAWSAKYNNGRQFLQVNFGRWVKITRVSLQGRQDANQWVKKFTLSYSYDGVYFRPYLRNNKLVMFAGNRDRYTVVSHHIAPAIVAHYVRFHPVTWHGHISLRADFYGCSSAPPPLPVCAKPLGMESGKIPDAAVIASSSHNAAHGPRNGRLNFKAGRGRTGAWSALHNDRGQFLQVDLGKVSKVTRMATQGRQDHDQWVTSYTLSYSVHGGHYHEYNNGQVFSGNYDRHNIIVHMLKPAIVARFVRIHPRTWHGHISMRAEIYGCTKGFPPPPLPKCAAALGMQSGALHDKYISSSSDWNAAHRAANGRLHFQAGHGRTGAWSARHNNVHQWLQIGGKWMKITRISTQGRQDANQWVKSYTLSYSYDGVWWYRYSKVFKGNSDRHTVVSHVLSPPITARFIRFHPKTWHGHISMRVEILGCYKGFPIPQPRCVAPVGMESGAIKDAAITSSSDWNAGHRAANGRLNFRAGRGRTGAWSARHNDRGQFLEVKFAYSMEIRRVATQGRQDANQWVTSYTLSYSRDGGHFYPYKNNQVFRANGDRNTIVIQGLSPPIKAVSIRIHPRTWHGHVSLRAEFYGCRTKPLPPLVCMADLGMESRAIPDRHISASSNWNAAHRAANARLHFQAGGGRTGAWSAKQNNAHQWLKVYFGKWVKITRMSTQGRQDANQWVKKYSLSYSYDGVWWYPYIVKGKLLLLNGNNDRHTVVSHVLPKPIIVRYIRIHPKAWHGHVSMRVGLYGCTKGFPIPKPECVAPLGMESGAIKDAAIKSSSDWNAAHRAANGRLNFRAGKGRTGAWSARYNDVGQWLQVGFAKTTEIRRVALQGRQDADQWVTSYTLSFSPDGGHFYSYRNNKLFRGNRDRNTIVIHELYPPIKARFIRIHVRSWHGHVSMRAELYGCKAAKPPAPIACMSGLGMESRAIPDKHISASSNWNHGHRAANARLHFHAGGGRTGAWSAKFNNGRQFLQINMGRWVRITRVSSQGRQDANQWVKKYSLSYSYDGVYFRSYVMSGKVVIFNGNTDRHTVVSHLLPKAIRAHQIRVHPLAWHGHISMRVDFYGCNSAPPPLPVCVKPLGMESGKIPDAAITATTNHNAAHGARNARLNFKAGGGRTGAWSARINDRGQYLQVDLGKVSKVTRMATQGRQDADQWVTSYTLSYSSYGRPFKNYKNGQVFSANYDRNNIIVHVLRPGAIIARYIRIHPRTWHGHMSMRAEIYGCREGFVPPKPPKCYSALGMQSGKIPDAAISASSNWNAAHRAANARLHFQSGHGRTGAWSAKHNNAHQFLQVHFGNYVKITVIATQGRQDANQWVKSFTLSYSYDGVFFYIYKKNKVFKANNDRYTVVNHGLYPPIVAKYIRIHPKTWHGHVSMRAEMFGCTKGFPIPQPKCVAPLGLESGAIKDAAIKASSNWNAAHRAANGRLNFRAGKGRTGAWSARHNDRGQWFQVDFGHAKEIRRVATQGRQDADQWVKSYTLFFSQDGSHFIPYSNKKVFVGNNNRNTIHIYGLKTPIIARFIRIHPVSWHGHISMRAEFYGCKSKVTPPPPTCRKAQGMQSGAIPDRHISASSNWNAAHRAANARLHFQAGHGRTGAWSARHNNAHQHLEIYFGKWTKITQISLQGRQDAAQWVTSFALSFSYDGVWWYHYHKVFPGNTDRHSVVSVVLPVPIIARYLRIRPKSWHGHVSMRAEIYGCTKGFPIPQPRCVAPVGMESGAIKDAAITSSSDWNAAHGARNGRLNFRAGGGRTGAWSAKHNDRGQWLQVDLGKTMEIRRVATQGRQEVKAKQWVTSYTLSFSQDGGHFFSYRNNKVFAGNSNPSSIVIHGLNPPITARFIRINVRTWHGHVSMRTEFYGCVTKPIPPPKCMAGLGMQSRAIPDKHISASSIWNHGHRAANGRLHFQAGGGRTGAWSAKHNNKNQWLQVYFGKWVKITRISTQGRSDANQWVKSYTLSYSYDGVWWYRYNKVFSGNSDRYTVVSHVLPTPITARYIRIHPGAWHGHVSMRADFYGCPAVKIPQPRCVAPVGMESGVIKDAAITSSSDWNAAHGARNGRLNFRAGKGRTGAWSARHNDRGQFLQVDLGQIMEIRRVALQGRQDADQWVTRYTLSYSRDGGHYYDYANKKVFVGNNDRNTISIHCVCQTLKARYIRIHPVAWHKHISLRAEFYGCKVAKPPPLPVCMAGLGMESRAIPDKHISASSEWNHGHRAANARLHFQAGGGRTGAWSAKYNNGRQFLQVNLGRWVKITRINTQGRQDANQWVKKYTLSYSYDGVYFRPYNLNNKLAMFTGNKDRHTVVSHVLPVAIIARFIRVHPTAWQAHISMRADFYGCNTKPPPLPVCAKPLGMESGKIPDAAITSSSDWNAGHRAANGRLNFHAGKGRTGAWSAKVNDRGQFLEVDLGRVAKVTRMATQGRQDADQWVTSYTLSYSTSYGGYFYPYNNGQVLHGNYDRSNIIVHLLKPVYARFVRIHPRTWHGHISMRAEIYGCTKGFVPPRPPTCAAALGMQNGRISDKQISASSNWNHGHRAANARLHFHAGGGRTGAWSAKVNNGKQWLQVSFSKWTKVTIVATQGRQEAAQWVKSYRLSFSYDGVYFYEYMGGKVLTANNDQHSVVGQHLAKPIIARHIRILPVAWHAHISMRAEFYGCTRGFGLPQEKCVAPVGLESGKVKDSAIKSSSDWNAAHRAANGRLNFRAGKGRTGAWSALHNDHGQWFEVGFAHTMEIRRVATQGRQDADQWVKSYTLFFSQDGSHFIPYKNKMVFTANEDRNTISIHALKPYIGARYVRIHPVSWHGHISLRAELYGCRRAPISPPSCMKAQGMQSGAIPDSHISASSIWNAAHRAANARLHFQAGRGRTGAWSSRHNNGKQWLQVNFGRWTKVTRMSTQGRQDADQWVLSYTLTYSYDGVWWYKYNKVLPGNVDRHSVMSHVLSPPIITRYIRINPRSWKGHISMRAEFYGCTSGFPIPKPRCVAPVGLESGKIPDAAISASSDFNAAHRAANGRLNFRNGKGRTGAWSALHNDRGQWFQVDFGKHMEIRRVATQGRRDANQWVTSYTLEYSQHGGYFHYYNNRQVFSGNYDRNTIVIHGLTPPIKARYIRIHVRSWHGHVSMRAEFYGCKAAPILPPKCKAALGMQNRAIPDGHISASTIWNAAHRAANARLHFQAGRGRTGAWSARHNNVHQWLQVYFNKWVKITAIKTQGRQDANQWVKKYSLSYSYDGVWWYRYIVKGKLPMISGNSDRHTVVTHMLAVPIIARYIRIHPKAWHGHVSMRAEFFGCTNGFPIPKPKCVAPVGMESGAIKDAAITSSSDWNAGHRAANGRLNFHAGRGRTGAWSARHNDQGQWLQVDLGKAMEIRRVATQGRHDADQWVKSYTLEYSQDGGHFYSYKNNKVFSGNYDRNTIVIHGLTPPIKARYVRFHVRSWHGHVSMRAEFYGCKAGPLPPPKCMAALGMQNRAIPDGHISASSIWNHGHRAANGRLHFQAGGGRTGAWSARHNNVHQWLQVYFNKWVKITRMSTQGRQDANQWVKNYWLSYSYDGVWFYPYRNKKVLGGNSDRHKVVSHVLAVPIIARYIRIHPKAWHSHVSMRAEFFGCTSGFPIPRPKCVAPVGMESGAIKDAAITSSSDWNAGHRAANGRLNFHAGRGRTGAWSARHNDRGQWLQVDLGKTMEIRRVATQGRHDADQWVTSYTLEYSQDGGHFYPYKNNQIFGGNKDRNTIVIHGLSPFIRARYIRIHPRTWHGHVSMRAEFYGCRTKPVPLPKCMAALGMQSGALHDRYISSSSDWNAAHRAANGRLHFQAGHGRTGAWSARHNNVHQWLQIGGKWMKITRISTQGRQDANQWVKSYTLSYSYDGVWWYKYAKVFSGNTDRHQVVYHVLKKPIIARFIRIHPRTWHGHVSMRAELFGCVSGFPIPKPRCVVPLGMESGRISDASIRASTEFNFGHRAANARLNFRAGHGRTGAWSARYNDHGQWIQIDLRRTMEIRRVAIQGRPDADQWVKSYTLFYSQDGGHFYPYENNKVFGGNVDRNSVVVHELNPSMVARYIRLQPKSWHGHISMRMELYGCFAPIVHPPKCMTALGMQNGMVSDNHISASSIWNKGHRAANGRLHFHAGNGRTGAWSAKHNNKNQWLQINLGQRMKITRVATQGRQDANQWVTKYTLSYSDNGVVFTKYKGIFGGNTDRYTVVSHLLAKPIVAQYVRIHPVGWHGHVSMRAELYGCGYAAPAYCIPSAGRPLGMEDGHIPDTVIKSSTDWDFRHRSDNGRLNFKAGKGRTGGWSARTNDVKQWLQVNFCGRLTLLTRVATQGRQDADQWVTSYTLTYSLDGFTFLKYNNGEVFQANRDRNTVVVNKIQPTAVRFIRIHPKTWHGHVSMRAEFYGCNSSSKPYGK